MHEPKPNVNLKKHAHILFHKNFSVGSGKFFLRFQEGSDSGLSEHGHVV